MSDCAAEVGYAFRIFTTYLQIQPARSRNPLPSQHMSGRLHAEAGYYLCQCDLGRKKLWEALYVQILGDTHICAQTGLCMHMDLHRCSICLSTGHLWRTNLFQVPDDIIKHKLVCSSQARL